MNVPEAVSPAIGVLHKHELHRGTIFIICGAVAVMFDPSQFFMQAGAYHVSQLSGNDETIGKSIRLV